MEREREGLSALGGRGSVLRNCLERNTECWGKEKEKEGRERREGSQNDLFGGEAVEEEEGEKVMETGELIKKHYLYS